MKAVLPRCIAHTRPVVPLVPAVVQRDTLLSLLWTAYLQAYIQRNHDECKGPEPNLFLETFMCTCLVRSYTSVCRDGVQSTLSVYMPGIHRDAFKHIQKEIAGHSNTLTLNGRVCIDVGHGSLLQHLCIVLSR